MISSNTIRLLTNNPLRSYVEEPAGFGGMSRMQGAFHQAGERLRFLRAANGNGKSFAGGAEAWWHLLGRHPYRDVPPAGGTGWLLVNDLKQGWLAVSKAMRQLEPADVLHPQCKYVDGVGYMYRSRYIIKIRDDLGGSLMVGKGCSQDLLSMEGDIIQWLWVDEPPKRSHWNGCRSRVNRTGGPTWVTMTPVGRPCGWLRDIIDGKPDDGEEPTEPGWWGSQQAWPLSVENAPHLLPERIKQLIDGYEEHERPQRVDGAWEGYTNTRRLISFTERSIIDLDHPLIERGFDAFRVGLDHGQGVGKQIGYLVGIVDPMTFVVLDEFYPKVVGSGPEDVARLLLEALDAWNLRIIDVHTIYGDINSGGLAAGGMKYNAFIEAELIRQSGVPDITIQTPWKGAGSVSHGEARMNNLIKHGKFLVLRHCRKLIHSARHYTGAERELKDPIDAVRYSINDLLRLPYRANTTPLRRG